MAALNLDISFETFEITGSYRFILNDICNKFELEDKRKIKVYDNGSDEVIYYDGKFVGYVDQVTSGF